MKASEPTTGEMRAARLEAIQGARQYIDEIGGQGEGGTSRYDTAAHTIKKSPHPVGSPRGWQGGGFE